VKCDTCTKTGCPISLIVFLSGGVVPVREDRPEVVRGEVMGGVMVLHTQRNRQREELNGGCRLFKLQA
jgi:hypothetical protein